MEVAYTGDDGRALGLTHDVDASGAVVQTFDSKRGTRVNRYVPLGDGGLRVEVAITSSLLNDALRYKMTYLPAS